MAVKATFAADDQFAVGHATTVPGNSSWPSNALGWGAETRLLPSFGAVEPAVGRGREGKCHQRTGDGACTSQVNITLSSQQPHPNGWHTKPSSRSV